MLSEQGPEQSGGAGPGTPTAGQVPAAPILGVSAKADGRRVFRLPGAVVLWWAWVVFAVANLVDIAISGRDRTSAEIAVALLVITALLYACALRPRVITDPDGISVLNPLRDHRMPWGSVTAIDLGDSVQVHCQPGGAATHQKMIYSWALYAGRRARYKAELRGRGAARGAGWTTRRDSTRASSAYGRMPPEAAELRKKSSAEIMCKQLADLARQARDGGAADGPRVTTWAWPALAAIAAPALALILLVVLG